MADSSPFLSPECQDSTRKKVSLECMSKEDLIKQVKKQLILLQKTKSKCDELNKRVSELEKERENVTVNDLPTYENLVSESSVLEKEAALNKTVCENKLQTQLKASEELCSNLQKERNSLQEQFDCINLKVETLSETCQVLQRECVTSQEQKQELLNQVELLTEARDTSVNSLKKLQDQLKENRDHTDAIYERLRKAEEEERALIGRLEECYGQLEAANVQNTTMQDDYAKMRTKWRHAEEECENLKLRIEELEASEHIQLQEVFLELEEAKSKIGELQYENAEKTDVNKQLENMVQNLEDEIQSLSGERFNLKPITEEGNENDPSAETENLKKQLDECRHSCKEIENMWEEQKKATSDLQEQLISIQTKRNSIVTEDSSDTEKIESLSTDDRYLKQIENLTTEKDNYIQKMVQMQRELNTKIQQWDLEKEQFLKNIDELEMEKQECVDQMLQTVTEMENQRHQWKAEKEELLNEIEKMKDLENRNEKRSERIQEADGALLQQLTEAMNNIRQLEGDLQKTHDSKQDVVEELLQVRDLQKFLEDEVKELRDECEKTKIEIKRLDADLENDSLHIRHLEKELCETEEREQASNQEAEALRNHIASVEAALQAAERQLSENSDILGNDLHLCREKLDQVESEYQNAMSKVLELQTEAEEFASKNEMLRTENSMLKANVSELSSVIQNRTDEMKTEEWEKEKCYLEEQLALQRSTIENLSSEVVELRETVFLVRENIEDVSDNVEIQNSFVTENDSSTKHETGFFDCEAGIAPIEKREPCSETDELRQVNEDLQTDLKKANENCIELQEVIDTKSQMIEKMLLEINNLLSQIDDLNAVVTEKEQDLESVATKLRMQTENLKSLETALEEKDTTLNSLRLQHQESIGKALESSRDKENKLTEIVQENDALVLEMQQTVSQNNLLQDQISFLTKDLEEIKFKSEQDACSFNDLLESLKNENKQLQEQIQILSKNLEEAKNHNLEVTGSQIVNTNEQVAVLNQELEESQTRYADAMRQLDALKNSFRELDAENSSLNFEAETMKTVIQNLKDKVQRLQHQFKYKPLDHGDDVHMVANTNLQTAEVEQELQQKIKNTEEKMAKFKAVAVKAKKDIVELKRERDNFSKQIEELSSTSRQHLMNFQSLQTEYDRVQDECETFKDTAEKMSRELAMKVTEVNSFEELVAEMKSEKAKLQLAVQTACQEKKSAEQARNEVESKVIILKSEKEAEQKKMELAKAESSKVDQRIKSLEEQLIQEKEQHKQTTMKLDHILQEAKHQNVLNLEIADYEHSISELNEKLQSKNMEISVLQAELSRQAEKIASLMEQIGYLEGQHDVEEERVESLKCALQKTKQEAAELKECNLEQQKQIATVKVELESVTALKEDFQVQLAESAAELSKICDTLKNAKESHARAAKSYESRLASVEEQLACMKKELESNRQEFDSYKVRVHSVLKQKQQPAVVNNVELEQKQRLEKTVEQLRLKLQQLSDELHARNVEMETLQQEHEHLLTRHTKVVNDFQRKDDTWMQKVDQLKKAHEHQQVMWETHMQHQLNMMEANYKKKALDQEMLHQVEIGDLHSKLAEKEKELTICQRENTSALHSPNEDAPFDILTQERQEGEGSESADPVPHYKPLSIVTIPTSGITPLEQLLQSSADPENNEILNQDAESLSANLTAAYKKLDHLTELLNESEASNMRMSEQVRILKEEIRRLERNKEREEHSSNLEYLKNIVVKFLTIQGSSERQRLLPVLSTILKLSPEEQAQLQTTTIGEPVQSDSAASGWGNYLHRWSGLT